MNGMTKKERNEWLKQVTGKKIRWVWHGAERSWVVVPTGEWSHEENGVFRVIDERGIESCWWASNGFKPNNRGYYWELIEDNIDIFLKEGL